MLFSCTETSEYSIFWGVIVGAEHGPNPNWMSQARNMADIPKHKHVVQMLGICDQPPCMVLEFVDGIEDLDEHLLGYRRKNGHKADGDYLNRAMNLLLDCAEGNLTILSRMF